MSPEGESLGDISASSCKLNPKLLNCLGVFRSSFRGPGSSGGIASLLQGHDVRPVPQNHLSTCQPADQALGVCHPEGLLLKEHGWQGPAQAAWPQQGLPPATAG